MKCFIYSTADLKSSKPWSSQFWSNLSNCEQKPEKVRTSTRFEPMTSRYWCALFQASVRNCLNCFKPAMIMAYLIIINSLPQFERYSATLGWQFAFAMDMAVLPFFDLTRKSAPCNIRNLTQVRWPFLAARCSGVQPDISTSSTSPSCWMRSFSTSKCPLADALCNAVDPDSSNALGLWTS